MADPRTFSNLRNILAQLYPDEASTRRVAHDAGLSTTRISFSAIAINTWHTILTEAENVNKVDALLDVVLDEYGDNPALRSACEGYRSAAQRKDAVPNDLKKGSSADSGNPKRFTNRSLWGIPILLLIAVGLFYGARFLTDIRTSATPTPPEATPTTAKAASLAVTSTPKLTLASPTIEPTSTAVPIATPTPTSTPTLQAGATRINPKDDAVYIYIPAGDFLMGSSDKDTMALNNEKPQHKVLLDAFWIMQTKVTNAQFLRCIEAGVCTKPDNNRWNNAAYSQYPVTHVDWNQVKSYAGWAGGRLPTEAEWEKACRGTDGFIYPWGDKEPSPEGLNFFSSGLGDTTVVGSYPAGAYGLYDMAGNVWEWTSSLWGKDWQKPDFGYPYDPEDGRENPIVTGNRVLRGGSFGSGPDGVRCAYRYPNSTDSSVSNFGFRVVSSQ